MFSEKVGPDRRPPRDQDPKFSRCRTEGLDLDQKTRTAKKQEVAQVRSKKSTLLNTRHGGEEAKHSSRRQPVAFVELVF